MLLKYTHAILFERIETIIDYRLKGNYYLFIIYSISSIILLCLPIIGAYLESGLFIIHWLYGIIIAILSGYLSWKLFNTKKAIWELGRILEFYKKNDESYDSISIILQNLDSIIIFLKNSKFYNFLISKAEKTVIINWLYLILTDLRTDISYNIPEQHSILTQAKSEVSTHIHGTTELNRVSELQQARLDKQIEQFEELQRVLVKV